MPRDFKFNLSNALEIIRLLNSTDINDLSEGEVPFGTLIYLLISIAFNGLVLPTFRVGAATFISAAFKALSILIFGEDTMNRMVDSDGYIYSGNIILKQYWEYGSRLRAYYDPMRALRKLLIGSEAVEKTDE
ncbi:uncharacterized protein [Palaemon carinicauda]|uniref:uncharacterized protein isoform X2 n=1 Tax=Palaemon carinicauda TaxID=392227 RepID=UPI0035B5E214